MKPRDEMELLAEVMEPGDRLCVINKGTPCRCGPGFCANKRGLGFIGYCAGSRAVAAPNCSRCGAPHQSNAGCWLCSHKGAYTAEDADRNAMWLRCLRLGVDGKALLDEQERRGLHVSCEQLLDEIEAGMLFLPGCQEDPLLWFLYERAVASYQGEGPLSAAERLRRRKASRDALTRLPGVVAWLEARDALFCPPFQVTLPGAQRWVVLLRDDSLSPGGARGAFGETLEAAAASVVCDHLAALAASDKRRS